MHNMRVARLLQHYMQQQDVTQQQLSVDSGVSQGRISEILSGRRSNSPYDRRYRGTIRKLALALGLPESHFDPPSPIPTDRAPYGAKIKAARQDRRLSLRQLADLSGVPFGTISRIENDYHYLPGSTIRHKLADALMFNDDIGDGL